MKILCRTAVICCALLLWSVHAFAEVVPAPRKAQLIPIGKSLPEDEIIAPDESAVAYFAGPPNKTYVFVRPRSRKAVPRRLLNTDEILYDLVWSPTGGRIAVRGYDHTFILSRISETEWRTGVLDIRCEGVGFSQDGRYLFGLAPYDSKKQTQSALIADVSQPASHYSYQTVKLPSGTVSSEEHPMLPIAGNAINLVGNPLALLPDGSFRKAPTVLLEGPYDTATGPTPDGWFVRIHLPTVERGRGHVFIPTGTYLFAESPDGSHQIKIPWNPKTDIGGILCTRSGFLWIHCDDPRTKRTAWRQFRLRLY